MVRAAIVSRVLEVLTVTTIGLIVLTPGFARSNDATGGVEITIASNATSYADDADWGWWDVGKYDQWGTSEDSDVDVAGARLVFPGDTYSIFVDYERYPTLSATGLRSEGSGDVVNHQIDTDIEVFDLALSQLYDLSGGVGISPWVGLTRFKIDETRTGITNGVDFSEDNAKARLWGIVVGVEVGARISQRLAIQSRLVARWARGDRSTQIAAPFPGARDQPAGTIELKDSTSRAMFGAELGLRWVATGYLDIEGGWRYRDWQYDDGPATFNGPFVRLSVGF